MKKQFLSLFLCSVMAVHGQDIIVKSNGDEVKAKITKVTDDEISYKRWANQNGPEYVVKTANIFMIKYQNGEKEVFGGNENKSQSSSASTSRCIEKAPDSHNAELIKWHNPEPNFVMKGQGGTVCRAIYVLKVSDKSVLSTDELEMRFVRKCPLGEQGISMLRYSIELKNKSNEIIYIDKALCSRGSNNGDCSSYYDNKEVNISEGKSSGGSIGLGSVAGALGVGGIIGTLAGGISLGGGSSTNVSTSYSQQRFIAIPPGGAAYLTEYKREWGHNKWLTLSDADQFVIPCGNIKKREYRSFSENDSPCHFNFVIVYSKSPNFDTYSFLNANVYVSDMMGSHNYLSNTRLTSQGIFDFYRRYIINADSMPSMLLGLSYGIY